MADQTAIEWCDRTWNPVTGCTKVSPGCDHCYAETIAERFRGGPAFPHGFDVQLRGHKLREPLQWRDPQLVFVNSMADLFHDSVPDEYIAQVFAVMAVAPRHTFQVLTKRHARMRALLSRSTWLVEVMDAAATLDLAADAILAATWPLPNVWLGVSTETQQWADIRIPTLLDTPAAVRFISAEPLLGPVDIFRSALIDRDPGLDWVIAGGESGRAARPMHPAWARVLRNECSGAGIPFFFKQWGEWAPVDRRDARDGDAWVMGEGHPHDPVAWRPDTVGAEAHRWGPHRDETMRRVGKKAAGRELDGRTWDEMPAVTR